MSDIFHDYMSKRLNDLELDNLKNQPGPVITISRQAGCSAGKLAQSLAARLNEQTKGAKWSVISKEVLSESAQKLQIHPKQIKSVFKIQDRSVLDEILHAFLSKNYHLERKMRNTVIKVIQQFAIEGHKIIVGRGAINICSEIENSLHIRFVAPLSWRAKKVMKSKKYNKDEAISCILNTEKDRNKFRHSIKGKAGTGEKEEFDLTINQMKYNNEEAIEIILAALKIKKLI